MSNLNNSSNQHYPYKLEKSSKKFVCPNCGRKSLKRYIDIETGNYLPEQYGRCNHENSCVPHYHLNPYLDGYAKAIQEQERGNHSGFPNNWKPQQKMVTPQPPPEPVFFDFDTYKQAMEPERYEQNTFFQNLINKTEYPFNTKDVADVAMLYSIGTITTGDWVGAVTLPYIDENGNIVAVQVKKFNEQNHTSGTNKLDKVILSGLKKGNRTIPDWLTKYIDFGDKYGYFTCLFGADLLAKYPSAKIYLFEAPKTAIYATLYFGLPEISGIVCMAVYNKSSLSFDKLKILQGRTVLVFPDLSKDGSTFREWKGKIKEYEKQLPRTQFLISGLLETLATPEMREKGADLADVLTTMDWRPFRKQPIHEQPPQPEPEKVTKVIEVTPKQNIIFSHDTPQPDLHDQQLANEKLWNEWRWGWEPESRTDLFRGFESYYHKHNII